MKSRRIIILETKEDFNLYLKKEFNSKDLFLPIGPSSRYELELRKFDFINFSDCWSDDEYLKVLNQNQINIDNLILDLDKYCKENLKNELEIGKYFSFQLWVIVSQINFNIFFIKNLIEKFKPKRILCFCKKKYKAYLGFRPDPSSYIKDILTKSNLSSELSIKFILSKEKKSTSNIKDILLLSLPFHYVNYLREIKNKFKLFKFKNSPNNMLLIGGCKEWFKLFESEVFQTKYNFKLPLILKEKKCKKPEKLLLDILNKSIFTDSIFKYDMDFIACHIQSAIKTFNLNLNLVDSYINKFDIAVSSTLVYPIDNFYAHRVSKNNKPLLIWQHGEKGASGFDILALYQELYYASDYLAYSSYVSELYKPWIGKFYLQDVKTVGSIDKSVNISNEFKDSIVYVTGKWYLAGQQFDYPSDPDKRLFDLQKNILEYLNNKNTQYKKIFKLNNTLKLNEYPFNFENIIISEKSFVKTLDNAHAVILDCPATTLIEAASTKVPIFAISGRVKYTDDFINLVSKRCIWCDTREDLLSKLDLFINTGIYDADINNKEFLEKYLSSNSFEKVLKNVDLACDMAIKRFKGPKY